MLIVRRGSSRGELQHFSIDKNDLTIKPAVVFLAFDQFPSP